jgi:DNA-binding transcriptional MerR regulator
MPATGLRIGELAQAAGVTTRAIRHYHEVGLLAEPARDGSGYRRYTATDLVALVRIRRLRALGMPIEQIAERIAAAEAQPDARKGTGNDAAKDAAKDLPAALGALAEDLTRQIDALTELRAKVLALAASPAADEPAATWSAALVTAGVLRDPADLPAGEREAIDLLDALAPNGIGELAGQVAALDAAPDARRRLDAALKRFRGLAPDAPTGQTDELAAEFVAAIGGLGLGPSPKTVAGHRPSPPSPVPVPVPVEVMDKLLGARLSPAQLHCVRRVRQLMEADDR